MICQPADEEQDLSLSLREDNTSIYKESSYKRKIINIDILAESENAIQIRGR